MEDLGTTVLSFVFYGALYTAGLVYLVNLFYATVRRKQRSQ